jgi:DNA-binding NarL/FixJ family response regulator
MGTGSLTISTLATVLDAVSAPAFIVKARGQIEYANAAGAYLFTVERDGLTARFAAAIASRDHNLRLTITEIGAAGLPTMYVVVMRPTPNDESATRLRTARLAWGLTDRQAEVVWLLARGDANKDIATKLRCSARTVELHVSAILAKARTESRAQLVARFWTQT